jgi:peptidoglycan/LPS O-acetylase OafA/YrhL
MDKLFARPKVAYRADVDGLRAISILAVIGFHAFPALVPGGFVGVDVFFVISGYLISTLIFTELKAGTFSFADFYTRRAKRIYPALLVVLIVVCAVGWHGLFPADFARLGGDIAAGASYLSNFFFWNQTGYFDQTAEQKPLLHLWSLAVEEQFYFLFPFAAFAAWKKRFNLLLAISVLGVLSFATNIALVYPDRRPAAFYLPQARFWELMIGSGLAYAAVFWKATSSEWDRTSRNLLAGLGLLLLLAAIYELNPRKDFPGWWALMPTAGAAFLIFSGPNAWINRTILSNRVSVFVGLISYPLYLWHWPLLSFARMGPDEELSGAVLIALVVLAFLLAWLTYEFVEKPIRFGRLPLPSWGVAAILAGFALLVITPGGILISIAGGVPERLPTALQWAKINQEETLAAYRRGTCFLPGDQTVFADDCVDKANSDEPLLVLWGDSNAADLYPGLRPLRDRFQFRLAQFTVSACPPLLNVEISIVPLCKQTNDETFKRVLALKPDFVVLSAQWFTLNEFHIDWSSLNNTIAALKGAGVGRVLVVGPVPVWRGGLPECLQQYYVRHGIVPFRMKHGAVLFSDLDRDLRERSSIAGASYVSPIDLMCDEKGCVTRVGERADDVITWDNVHLTIAGAVYLVGRFPQTLFSHLLIPLQGVVPEQDFMSLKQ